jgi:lactoylglutathione lyase
MFLFHCTEAHSVYAASERLEKLGYNVRRKPGPMMGTVHIAFVEDPDEYWVELIQVPK